MRRNSRGEQAFSVGNYIFLSIISFSMVYPFLYVVSASMSSADAVITGKVLFLPKELTLDAYRRVFSEPSLWISYANSFFYTIFGTAVNIVFTICGAYPLSKKRLRGRTVITFFVALTLWFKAGMIPFFLNIRDMGLLDQRVAILIAFACGTFYVILMRTYFQSIPDSLEESAKMDGASDLNVLIRIMLPLSVPALMTIGLYYAVQRWNGYFWSMVILRDINKVPLQVLLRKLIVEMEVSEEMMGGVDMMMVSQETVIYATIVIAVIPMMLAYPFIQKYFVKGVMIGSIKG